MVTGRSAWAPATGLFVKTPGADRRTIGVLGVPTFATALTPRERCDSPTLVRAALARYSTWSWSTHTDLATGVQLVDLGDVSKPDGKGAVARIAKRLGRLAQPDLIVCLGGDNAVTAKVLPALAGDRLGEWGLVTLDAHHDLRDGHSNGSVVRELLAAGLPGRRVVQIGLADFANAPNHAARALEAGITVVPRGELRLRPIEEVVTTALQIAGDGGAPVYVDVDLDVADRAVVPGCPAAVPGGLSADELRRAVRVFGAHAQVRAIDLTEFDSTRESPDQRTARLAALLVLEAAAGVIGRVP